MLGLGLGLLTSSPTTAIRFTSGEAQRFKGDSPTDLETFYAYNFAKDCGGKVEIEPIGRHSYDIVVIGCNGE